MCNIKIGEFAMLDIIENKVFQLDGKRILFSEYDNSDEYTSLNIPHFYNYECIGDKADKYEKCILKTVYECISENMKSRKLIDIDMMLFDQARVLADVRFFSDYFSGAFLGKFTMMRYTDPISKTFKRHFFEAKDTAILTHFIKTYEYLNGDSIKFRDEDIKVFADEGKIPTRYLTC